ncbi:hypothetical protein R1sor_023636 [Riccia sorocarpa]|uniref:C2 domain-containing protein n=1 Tax=Riccia sorocarpa TaxID=122646 RepID=A0ABD3GRJ3_9MARC
MGISMTTAKVGSPSLDKPLYGGSIRAGEGSKTASNKNDKVFGRGVFHVQIFKARDIKGDEIVGLGKADPYAVVKLGSQGNRHALKTATHQDGGASPIWNYEFAYPLRNGGTLAHNSLDIKIYNENGAIGCFNRSNNCIGSLRIENLGEYILSHENNITEPQWFPLLYKAAGSDQGEEKGEILVKFYFQEVDEGVFAKGFHTVPSCGLIPGHEVGVEDDDATYSRATGNLEGSSIFSWENAMTVLDSASQLVVVH